MDRTTLLDVIRRAHSARDVSRLFALLHYQPDDQPAQDGAQVVARWHGFQVVACWSDAPRDAARALARRLGAVSRRALAVGIGPTELALAAPRMGAPGITPLLAVARERPASLALQTLQELAPRRGDHGLTHALRVAEVLSTERAGERFFELFRVWLERMAQSLPVRCAAADRRAVALLALTRVLFLYFVQAKGWLDGRPDYLRSLLDDALAAGRDFHGQVLHPLFFGTLNRPPAKRSRRLRLGDIPYLNGGLFEPHPVERRVGRVAFSNALWRDAFDQLFERFRFCVREADEVNAVAPDMLGRVFERVMDEGERHATGTFYTPDTVVRQMVNAAIETALAGAPGIDPAAARRIVAGTVTNPAEIRAALVALRDLRVLDPAVGSGAFLLGVLDSLTRIRSALDPPRDALARCLLRRDILQTNLFGVDLSPVAVRLAELRLWLALVADDPTANIAAVTPLPNLDAMLRQGDTLFDPLAAANALGALGRMPPPARTRAMDQTRAAIFQAAGSDRTRLARTLRAAELGLARELLRQARTATDHELRDLAALAAGRDLFGRRIRLTPSQRGRHELLRRHRGDLRTAQRALADGTVPFFSYQVHAPSIAASGGFNLVLGNPPWVRAERLPPATRRALGDRYRWWRAPRGAGFRHQPDLAVAFLERSMELTRPGGAVALLLPSKVASADYGEMARTQLVREATLTYLYRIPDRQAGSFGATTYPLAVVLKKRPAPPRHTVHLGFEGDDHLTQEGLHGPGPWILQPDRTRDAVHRFLAAGTPLARIAPPGLGVKTGADRFFVGTLECAGAPTARVRLDGGLWEIEAALLRPAVQGRDVRPFSVAMPHVIVWAYRDGAPLPELPPGAAAYFAARAAPLRRRADHVSGPPWTLFRTRVARPGWRVVWPDIARRPAAAVLECTSAAHAVPLNTCYVARAPDRVTAMAVAAVLNSTWAHAAALATADEARGGYRRINARVTRWLPVPPDAARATLAHLAAAAHQDRHVHQDQLDDAVAEALGLSGSHCDLLRRLTASHR
jgi:hypothetical protein